MTGKCDADRRRAAWRGWGGVLPAAVLAAGGSCLAAHPATARSQQVAAAEPTRNGDVFGGQNHQPTRAEVEARQRADGLPPPAAEPPRGARQAEEVDRLYRELMDRVPPRARPAGA